MQSKAQQQADANNGKKTTWLQPLPNSCKKCWNKVKGSKEEEPETEKTETAPRYRGIYVSIPVKLIELNGKISFLGYRAQCPICKDIYWYPNAGCLYRLDKEKPDCDVFKWDIVRRNGLDVSALQDAVYYNPNTRYFEAAKLPKFRKK